SIAAEHSKKSKFGRFLFEARLGLASATLQITDAQGTCLILNKVMGMHKRMKLRLFEPWFFQAMADCAPAMVDELESKKHLLNARTTLIELAYNISDPEMRQHYLNRPDSRALLARTEDLEDLAYEGFPEAPSSPQATRALESIARINEQLHRRDS